MMGSPKSPPGTIPDRDNASRGASSRLSKRVRLGALWSIASSLLLRLTSIFVTAVVAHILDPRDFGVFAVALTAYTIVSSVGELGVSSCLIRADLDIDSLAPTMTSVSLATSAILAGTMVVFAAPIGTALGSASAAGPIRVMAIAVILVGVFAVPNSQLIRDFKQDKLFLSNVISFVPSTAALLLLAKFGSGAMAFAWSRVVGQFVTGCVLVVCVPKVYRPGMARSALSLLVKFGLPLAAANFVNYILLNVNYAFVGHLLGAVALGSYVLAFNVASWPSSLLGSMINNVSMPAFSRVKSDLDNLRHAISNALRTLALVVMPMCALIMALARPLVLTLYGERWATSANVLSILALYGAISIICLLFANILASLGRTKFLLVVQLIWLCALVPAMAFGVRENNIVGAAFAHIAVIVPIVLPCYLYALKRAAGVRLTALARACLPALLASSVTGLAARYTAAHFTSSLVSLAAGLTAGSLIYLIAVFPQAIALLGAGYAAKAPAKNILRFYHTAGRLLGLRVGAQPKHAVRRGAQIASQSREVAEDGYSTGLADESWEDQQSEDWEDQQRAGLAALLALAKFVEPSTRWDLGGGSVETYQRAGSGVRWD